jgi:hypothetical protein
MILLSKFFPSRPRGLSRQFLRLVEGHEPTRLDAKVLGAA